VYVSPQQLDKVCKLLKDRGLIFNPFTMKEGKTPRAEYGNKSEREHIIENFERGVYQVLVAMKCLDEGVDVKPAKTAVLMCSSGNFREYVQRIGRVLRRSPGKIESVIHDIIVIPKSEGYSSSEVTESELKIFKNEMRRYEEIAKYAINYTEAMAELIKVKNKIRGIYD
jgi:superfamily II DNA or RNA helicase